MCQVSEKIKLCTCKTKNVEQLKHYWRIKRRSKKAYSIVGEISMPADIGEENDKLNKDNILNQLNTSNIFDIEMQHKHNDVLELIFSFKADREKFLNFQPNVGDYLAYAFKFKNGEWKKYDYKNWVVGSDEVHKGKIVNPFKRKYSGGKSK